MKSARFRPGNVAAAAALTFLAMGTALAGDLPEVRKAGVLRHLGIPYANFVSGAGDGMDVEIIQLFAKHLGVRYEYVRTDWGTVVEDLVGQKVKPKGEDVELGEKVPVRGDLIANGFTMFPWRMKVVDYSTPTFPSQIWLVARADSKVAPIKPSGEIGKDIAAVRALMKGRSVLALKRTCLDPDLYKLEQTGATVVLFGGKLNEMAPALLRKDAELTILDVPDALIAVEKWGGQLKVLGPVTDKQKMAVGFPKGSPELREEFNAFFAGLQKDGTYDRLVKKYYPTVGYHFPDFFQKK